MASASAFSCRARRLAAILLLILGAVSILDTTSAYTSQPPSSWIGAHQHQQTAETANVVLYSTHIGGGHGRQRNRRRQAGRNADGSGAAAAVVQGHPSEQQAEAERVPAQQPTHHGARLRAVLSRAVALRFEEAERVLVLSARAHGADINQILPRVVAAVLAGSAPEGVHRHPQGSQGTLSACACAPAPA